jgi:hypothetical protein
MRLEDWREATRKAAERATSRRKACLSPGEKRNRMATVASLDTVAPPIRTAEVVMKVEERAAEPPKVQNKRVWASVVHPPRRLSRSCSPRRADVVPPRAGAG